MIVKKRTEFGSLLEDLIKEAHTTAKEHGWYDETLTVPHSFMLIVDELCESMQEYRKNGKTEEFVNEISDVFIRLFDFLGYHQISGQELAKRISEKMEFNKTRPYRHGNKPF